MKQSKSKRKIKVDMAPIKEQYRNRVQEMAGVIAGIIASGEADAEDVYFDLRSYCDRSLVGNLPNSPIFLSSLSKELLSISAGFAAVDWSVNGQDLEDQDLEDNSEYFEDYSDDVIFIDAQGRIGDTSFNPADFN